MDLAPNTMPDNSADLLARPPEPTRAKPRPLATRVLGRLHQALLRNRWLSSLTLPLRLLFNRLLIVLHLDSVYVRMLHEWKFRPFFRTRSLQENVGFSHRDDVDEALHKVHATLRATAEKHVPARGKILDIGSGTGLVTKQLTDQWQLVGIDISASLTDVAREVCPDATFLVGDILETDAGSDFNLAFCIGVLCYIPPSQLERYFRRIHGLLADDGIFFLQYPHAIARLDLWHPNLLYTKHSPRTVERTATRLFDKLAHGHSFFDGHPVDDYDRDPFPKDSFVNGYLYIGRKRRPS